MDKKKHSENGLYLFAGSVGLLVFFTFAHNLFYNWVFLPDYFEENGWQLLIDTKLLAAYWNWIPGRILVICNSVIALGPIAYWLYIGHLVRAASKEH